MSKDVSNIKPTLVDKLIAQAGNVDVYIIPDTEDTRPAPKEKEPIDLNALKKDLLKSFVILSITTLISYLFFEIGFADSSIMMVYILGGHDYCDDFSARESLFIDYFSFDCCDI